MNLKEKLTSATEEEMIELLSSNGMLVKRPLVITDNGVLIGFKKINGKNSLNKFRIRRFL